MTSHRHRKRHFRSACIPSCTHTTIEALETRQLLSATGSTDAAAVETALGDWRDSALAVLTNQADDRYSELYGTETRPHNHIWLFDPVFDGITTIAGTVDAFNLASEGAPANANFSRTNVQVDGVDEGDIVETDGEYIYTLTSQQELVIVKAATQQGGAEVVSRTSLSVSPVAMFLHDGRLTVISQNYRNSLLDFAQIGSRERNRTSISVLDVTDPTTPSLLQETLVDGDYQSARAIGDQVYVVLSNNNSIPYLPSLNVVGDNTFGSGHRYETRDEFLSRLHALVHGVEGERDGIWPPSVYQRSNLLTSPESEELQRLGWLDAATDTMSADSGQLTSVLRFDTASSTPGPADNLGVYNRRHSNSTIYASENAVYLVATEYEQVENEGFFIIPFTSEAFSRVHKIDISSQTMELSGIGTVPGTIESRFSVDEYNGYLRVATTTGNTWGGSSENHLYVLEDTGTELEIIGRVENLAPGERIYSMRFAGDRGWMVTFRQVDPVFSFDLSDPVNPVVAGELKITGYSDYLQLIDDNLLLAIGRNATEQGRLEDVQVSLFDVSDMTAPALVDKYSFGGERWGHSSALYDHHAFNYLSAAGILAVPFRGDFATRLPSGQSLTLLSIDVTNGIDLLAELPPQTAVDVQRSIQIDNLLYAISGSNIQVIDLSDPATVIDEILFNDQTVPVFDRHHLISALTRRLEDLLDVRQYRSSDGTNELRVELTEVLNRLLPHGSGDTDYEFRISDITTGAELLREFSADPFLTLQDALTTGLEDGTYNFQVRTRSRLLNNPDWAEWTPSTAITIGSDIAEMVSAEILNHDNRRLRWSAVADRVLMTEQQSGGVTREENPVSHYELWLSDAVKRELIEWNRNIAGTEFDVSDLPPGHFWAWFRPVFEDGTIGNWSRRHAFETLGRQLELDSFTEYTADRTPVFAWEELTDAASFEIEIATPDGTEVIYDISQLPSARHELSAELDPGIYSFRVRALLPSGGATEWTAPRTFTIVDRPELAIANNTVTWDDNGASRHEIWVSRFGTTDPLFHETDLTTAEVRNAVSAFGLDSFGRFSVWVRSFMSDGSRTAWSRRAVLQRFADAVSVNPIPSFRLGDAAALSWNIAEGVESYEVYVRKRGESGPFYRQAGITDLAHSIATELSAGDYQAWVRGALSGGGHTKWGPAHSFNVSDQPVVSVVDNVVSWLTSGTATNAQYEVWVNRMDENFRVLDVRTVHLTDLLADSLDLDYLPDGNYSVWVRQIENTGGEIVRSAWSQRVNFEVSTISDLVDAFQDGVDDLLGLLDRI